MSEEPLVAPIGCYWYVGMTQTGKTTKAYVDTINDCLATGKPVLVIDPMPAWNFRDLPHQASVGECLERLFGRRTHAIYTPKTGQLGVDAVDQVDQLMRGITAEGCGGILVLWDECSFHMSKQYISDGMTQALRGWAHHEITFRLITQRPGDIHGDAYACDPEVYAFRTEKDGDLERLKAEFNLEPDKLKVLGEGQYLTKHRGFKTA